MIPVVSVICCAYNHGPYIRQCLDGFMMQKTGFSFEVLIHDDASTDNTAKIIREYELKYPDTIFPIYAPENKYSKGIDIFSQILLPKAKGKYIAICEGDDYWTDPLKLQKQVDIMEKHPNVGLVYTAFNVVDKNGGEINYPFAKKHMDRSVSGDVFLNLLFDNFPQTLTVIFRKSIYKDDIIDGLDYSLFLDVSLQSDFFYINEVTGAYRINPEGMMCTGTVSAMDFNYFRLYYLSKYFVNKLYHRECKAHLLICKYFLLHQCHMSRYKKYKPLYDKILNNNIIMKLLFPLGVLVSSLVTIKQKYEKYD